MNIEHQTCTNCVMDTTDSKIIFDLKGVCDHCNTYYKDVLPNWHTDEKGDKALKEIVEKIKKEGEGKDFDCLMGMSGGIDSSFLLHILVNDFNLKPLVFHVDGGWNSEEAVNNINNLVNRLNLDLYTEVIDWDEMRNFQLALFKSGVPHLDIPQDLAFISMLYKYANKHKIMT